jgi:predicted SAM-dependent methyltransferase
MRYLNVGCGSYYLKDLIWSNVDFISNDSCVISHNLLQGIPFDNSSFDLVYHSHVLEHFSKRDGYFFLSECFRVLKPNGVLRIVIPNLENIVREYLNLIELGLKNQDDEIIKANYDWIMLEMYDQTVRNSSGGNMGEFLMQENLINEDFIYQRIGEEGKLYRTNNLNHNLIFDSKSNFILKLKNFLKNIYKIFFKKSRFYEIGKFRSEGEVHQWMYDRYSLSTTLRNLGFCEIEIRGAFDSYIENWKEFNLDGKNGIVRKPDSLFIEARKIV